MGEECGRVKRRQELVTAPITIPQFETATLKVGCFVKNARVRFLARLCSRF
jgi:hypothetical protein